MTPPRNEFPLLIKIAMGFLGALTFLLLLPALIAPPVKQVTERESAVIMAKNLARAGQAYREETGEYPHGEHAQILAALRGANPKKTVFFACDPDLLSADGELLDPWKTPYSFKFDTGKMKVSVISAGPNKTFDPRGFGGDDLAVTL